jgi:hypothetical protein
VTSKIRTAERAGFDYSAFDLQNPSSKAIQSPARRRNARSDMGLQGFAPKLVGFNAKAWRGSSRNQSGGTPGVRVKVWVMKSQTSSLVTGVPPAFLNRFGTSITGVCGARCALSSKPGTAPEERRRAGAVTRQLRWLRAHGRWRKVSGTHRYVVTGGGRKIITALLAARQADVEQLTALAA